MASVLHAKEGNMNIDSQVNYIEIPALDLKMTKQFYNKVFGWTFIDYGSEYMAIEGAGIDGGFYLANHCALTQDGSVLLVIYKHSLKEAVEKVELHGGGIIKNIFSFPGGQRFHFKDPNGNELAVWSKTDS